MVQVDQFSLGNLERVRRTHRRGGTGLFSSGVRVVSIVLRNPDESRARYYILQLSFHHFPCNWSAKIPCGPKIWTPYPYQPIRSTLVAPVPTVPPQSILSFELLREVTDSSFIRSLEAPLDILEVSAEELQTLLRKLHALHFSLWRQLVRHSLCATFFLRKSFRSG